MTDAINVSNTAFNQNGTLTFSGLSSGIDIQGAVDSIMSAKRLPALRYQEKISQNSSEIGAFAELKTISTVFSDVLDGLRGKTGYFTNSVFDSKVAFLNSRVSPTAGDGHSPSSGENILGVALTKDADTGTHVIEVVQLAEAHQIRTDAIEDKFAPLQDQGFTIGTLSLNGQQITVEATDSIVDLKEKINLTSESITASVVSISENEHFLVLGMKETGAGNAIEFAGGSELTESIGLTSVGLIKNELRPPQDAIIRANNMGFEIARNSNTIDDVFEGVTIDLFSAEVGTQVVIDIENNLGDVKQSLADFVEAYNLLKDFIDDQRSKVVREENSDPEYGPLAFNQTLRSINQELAQVIGASVVGQPDGFSSLGQIGITMNSEFRLEIDDGVLDNKLLTGLDHVQRLFEFQSTVSDSRVSVTGFNMKTVTGTYYLNISGTDASGNVSSANISNVQGAGAGGADDGSVELSGLFINPNDITGADGLNIVFNAGSNATGIDDVKVTVSRGLADKLFSIIDTIGRPVTGTIDQNIRELTGQIEELENRVSIIDQRLEITRASLTARFIAMEQAISQSNSLMDSLSALNKSNDSQ